MLKLDDIRNAVTKTATRHGLSKVTLFGSFARGDAQEGSDVDLIVESPAPLGFARGAIYRELEQSLDCPVDFIFGEKNLYPFVRKAAQAEGVVLYEA